MAGDVTEDGAKPPYGENVFGNQTHDLRNQLVSRARYFPNNGTPW